MRARRRSVSCTLLLQVPHYNICNEQPGFDGSLHGHCVPTLQRPSSPRGREQWGAKKAAGARRREDADIECEARAGQTFSASAKPSPPVPRSRTHSGAPFFLRLEIGPHTFRAGGVRTCHETSWRMTYSRLVGVSILAPIAPPATQRGPERVLRKCLRRLRRVGSGLVSFLLVRERKVACLADRFPGEAVPALDVAVALSAAVVVVIDLHLIWEH